jgi:hypothetical protein
METHSSCCTVRDHANSSIHFANGHLLNNSIVLQHKYCIFFLLIIECYIHSILLYIYHCLFNIFVTACNPKADIAFLLDSSGSVGQKNFRLIKNFVYGVVEQMTIGKVDTRVGVVSYSTAARMGFHIEVTYKSFGRLADRLWLD